MQSSMHSTTEGSPVMTQHTTARPAEKVGVPSRFQPGRQGDFATGLAAAIAMAVSMLHFAELPGHWAKALWLGIAFAVGATALLYTAVALLARPSLTAWWVGAGATGLMFIGGILSRTTGLFGVYIGKWGTPLIVSLVLEAAFVVVWLARGAGTGGTVRAEGNA